MMQVLREKFKGWVAVVIFTIIGLTFVLWGVGSYLQDHGRLSNQVIATVNKEKITVEDFQNKQQQLNSAALAKASSEQKRFIKSSILNSLIRDKLLSTSTEDAGYVVDPQFIVTQVLAAPSFQEQGRFSPQKFQLYLQNNRMAPMTVAAFAQARAREMAQYQLPSGMGMSSFITPKEQQQLLALFRQKRSFATVTIPLSAFYDKVIVTEKEIKNYYKQNKGRFVTAEKVKLHYIMLSPKAIAAKVLISASQVKQYYSDNKQHYVLPARWKVGRLIVKSSKGSSNDDIKAAQALAVKVRAQLAAGKVTMHELQKSSPKKFTYVQQPIVATQVAGTALMQVLSNLQQGQFSSPVRTTQGFNIFKMISVKSASVRPLGSVKQSIAALLKQREVGQKFTAQAQLLGDMAYTHPDSLDPVAKQMGLVVQTSAWLPQAGTKKGLFADASLLNAAFSKDVLQHGNNSRPLPLSDGSVIVLRVAQHVAAKPKPLAQVQSAIKQTLLRQSAARFAGVAAYSLQTKWLAGQQLLMLQRYHYDQYLIHKGVLRSSKAISPLLLSAVFQLSLGDNSIKTIQLDNGDYLVVKLLGVNNASKDDYTAAQRESLMRSVKSVGANIRYAIYVQGLLKQAKVTNNTQAIADIRL